MARKAWEDRTLADDLEHERRTAAWDQAMVKYDAAAAVRASANEEEQ